MYVAIGIAYFTLVARSYGHLVPNSCMQLLSIELAALSS